MKIHLIPYSFDNYAYLLMCEETGEAAVVDPGEAYPVQRAVADCNAHLTTVLCTHHHRDHVGGLDELLAEKALRVVCHTDEATHIQGANFPVRSGEVLKVGNMEIEPLHTPGHTHGSIVYRHGKILFTGDTLFGAGCGRLFEGTAKQMFTSLNATIANLSDDTSLYFGHEYTLHNLQFAIVVDPMNPDVQERVLDIKKRNDTNRITSPSTLAQEKRTNPFLRCKELRLMDCATELQTFTKLRKMRNLF